VKIDVTAIIELTDRLAGLAEFVDIVIAPAFSTVLRHLFCNVHNEFKFIGHIFLT
jgi:hypothetical protein